jgi:hypothetical protein
MVNISFWFTMIYIYKNVAAIVAAGEEIGLEVNADKTNYMVMSQHQTAGRSHNIKTDNDSIGRVEQFKYFGTTLTYENSTQVQINSRRQSGNACCHLVRDV